MDNLNELLSSISPEDMEKLKDAAASIFGNSQQKSESEQKAEPKSSSPSGDELTRTLMSVASQMNREDDRTKFISSLRPLLSEERQKKADEAIKFMKLMDLLPLVKGYFGL